MNDCSATPHQSVESSGLDYRAGKYVFSLGGDFFSESYRFRTVWSVLVRISPSYEILHDPRYAGRSQGIIASSI